LQRPLERRYVNAVHGGDFHLLFPAYVEPKKSRTKDCAKKMSFCI